MSERSMLRYLGVLSILSIVAVSCGNSGSPSPEAASTASPEATTSTLDGALLTAADVGSGWQVVALPPAPDLPPANRRFQNPCDQTTWDVTVHEGVYERLGSDDGRSVVLEGIAPYDDAAAKTFIARARGQCTARHEEDAGQLGDESLVWHDASKPDPQGPVVEQAVVLVRKNDLLLELTFLRTNDDGGKLDADFVSRVGIAAAARLAAAADQPH